LLLVNNEAQSGSWAEIGVGSSANISKDVFKIWINHPNPPVKSGSYQYIVVPGIDYATFQQKVQSYQTEILVLQNSAEVSAVFHSGLSIMGAIFWAPGKVSGPTSEWNLSADKPCVVLVAQKQNAVTISVANPQQDAANNDVTITISRHLTGAGCNSDGTTTTSKFSLRNGEFAGSTTSQTCNAA